MADSNQQSYTVVARRYRPKTFGELIGQSQVATALTNAIKQNRVGHAYLFTGARGVGKTSSARIFAKCLNCKTGPTIEPCNECDPCIGISAGEDVDVIEIDGASNRGIDNIRELRSNANIRPSRSNYKIYIIDEVHMLSREAFNALLKTLEEPPGHVKFIFCTTDPEKIPITVLSRCQRFDFIPVQTEQIKKRLAEICENENVKADEAALTVLAQRAKGSLRDSQSLLEQLLSFTTGTISSSDVHQLLGTADSGIIFEIAQGLLQSNSRDTLEAISRAIESGVDAGQLTEQLLGLFRDVMTFKAGCGAEIFQQVSPDDLPQVEGLADAIEMEPLLTILQILDKTLVSMRLTSHGQTLLEMACVRISSLSNLQNVATFLAAFQSGKLESEKLATALAAFQNSHAPSPSVPQKSVASEPQKKNEVNEIQSTHAPHTTPQPTTQKPPAQNPPTPPTPSAEIKTGSFTSATHNQIEVTPANVEKLWHQAMDSINDTTAVMATNYQKLAMVGENQLVVTLSDSYNKQACERPEKKRRLEEAFETTTGRRFRIDFEVGETASPEQAKPVATRRQIMHQLRQHPVLQKVIEDFDGEIIDFRPNKPK